MIDYRIGDTRDVIATIPDGSVSLVACSPPFLALRSYLPADHEAKHAEIGSEPDPATFLDTLLGLTAEWGRVLAPWGSIAIEMGDTYAGTGVGGGRVGSLADGTTRRDEASSHAYAGPWANPGFGDGFKGGNPGGPGWPRAKSLALIPQLYATSLAYGRNLLTGRPSPAGQWLVRNMVVWHRPNPAVGALGDKYRPSTSYITVATRSPRRWFDLTAVRDGERVVTASRTPGDKGIARAADDPRCNATLSRFTHSTAGGAPPLDAWFDEHDTWTITTQPSRLAHYAMWPPKLAERLVLSMCPEWVCAECGEPRRRVEGAPAYLNDDGSERAGELDTAWRVGRVGLAGDHLGKRGHLTRLAPTIGWTDCGHDNYQPGLVLDPFAGTGTTMCVAELHGRDSIGIDLDPRNRDLLPARMDEVRRALFGTKPEMPGQLDMFGEAS